MPALQESQELINAKVAQLNANSPAGERGWTPLAGLHALTQFQFLQNSGAMFTPSSGYPIKVFVNTITGEVKIFPAINFIGNIPAPQRA
jgi:hypothetical protein